MGRDLHCGHTFAAFSRSVAFGEHAHGSSLEKLRIGHFEGSERIHVMGVWNSSKQTLHDMIPVFRVLSLLKHTQKTGWMAILDVHVPVRPSVWRKLHFDVAGFLMIAERARELSVQVARHFLLGRRLPLGLPAPHL